MSRCAVALMTGQPLVFRGETLGVGLGDGVQKLFYLPEAHTDFIFAVIAEELGLIVSYLDSSGPHDNQIAAEA